MRFHPQSALLLWAAIPNVLAAKEAAETTTTATHPCTATATSGAFYDLRPDIAVSVDEGEKAPKGVPTIDYLSKGYDYGSNFTVNICGAVVKPVKDAVGVDKPQNISAYYESKGKIYSLGQQSSVLTSRGRELVLQYKDGSPCPDPRDLEKRGSPVHDGASYRHHVYDDEDDEYMDADSDKQKLPVKEKTKALESSKRRKSATFAFLCDLDPLSTGATVSFVGTPDECAYFFKVRSQHACAGAEPQKPGNVGPGGVFMIIFFVFTLVYFIGGVFYQRTVNHARGWRQLPNYSFWAGLWSFISDAFIILTSSCARFFPNRSGYRTLSSSPSGRYRNRDDENRLIDQLDEEWDD